MNKHLIYRFKTETMSDQGRSHVTVDWWTRWHCS